MHVPWITIDTPDNVRVCNGTLPLSIMVYIDGSFIKNKIAVKPIYITVQLCHNIKTCTLNNNLNA